MRRSLTATVSSFVSGRVTRQRATDDDARWARVGANRRPVTRLVESGEGERLAGRGAAATGRRDAPAALAALLVLLAAAGPAAHPRHALHELLHLAELLDELADLGGLGAAAVGDAQPPRAVDDRRVGPLAGGHRPDDRLDPVDPALVDLGVADLLGHARHHPHEVLER